MGDRGTKDELDKVAEALRKKMGEMKEQHTIQLGLPAYFFHRLMNELLFGTCLIDEALRHDPEICNRLYKMLAAQVGQEVVEK